jgi:hypothetical protein
MMSSSLKPILFIVTVEQIYFTRNHVLFSLLPLIFIILLILLKQIEEEIKVIHIWERLDVGVSLQRDTVIQDSREE